MSQKITVVFTNEEYDAFLSYAKKAGLDIEAFARQATSYFFRTDVLGVRDAEMKQLESETRVAELLSRKKRAESGEKKMREKPLAGSESEPCQTMESNKSTPSPNEGTEVLTNEDLGFFVDSTVSNSDLEFRDET